MNLTKFINKATCDFKGKVYKLSSGAGRKTVPRISGFKLQGLDALANQNFPVVKKSLLWEIPEDSFKIIKETLSGWFSDEEMLDDKSIKYIASNFMNLEAENLAFETDTFLPAFAKFTSFDKATKNKFFDSQTIKTLFEATKENSFKYSCFEIPTDDIDELDKLLNDSLIKHCFKSYLSERPFLFQDKAINIPANFRKSLEFLPSFCKTKVAIQYYNLLKQRNYEDVKELSKIIFDNTQTTDANELKDIFQIFKKLLNAKTPNGDFIFGMKGMADKSTKNMLSGIENILGARKNNPEQFEKYLELLQLTQEGKIPANVLGILGKEGKINDDFLESVNKLTQGKSQISKFSDLLTANKESNAGDVVQIGKKIFYKDNNKLTRLNLQPKTFMELFPEIETKALGQGQDGDCYLISAISDFLKNPHAKGKIYQMFSQNGDDIIITLPDAKNYPIKYSKKALQKNGKNNVSASLGIQILEDAYHKTRALKYGTANKLSAIEGGFQFNVYNAFLGNNSSKIFTCNMGETPSMDEVNEALKKTAIEIIETKENILKLRRELRKETNKGIIHLTNFQIAEQRKRLSILEATQRSNFEIKTVLSNMHQATKDELLEKVLNTSLEDNLISCGTKANSTTLDKSRMIDGAHAYSILNINKENNTIDIVNPWNTAAHYTISFDEFKQWFDCLSIAKLS